MFIDLVKNFLRRYWWAVVILIGLIIGLIWWYQESQLVNISGYKISAEAAEAVGYYQTNDLIKAQAKYEEIVVNHSRDWFSWNGLANVYRDQSMYTKAEEAYLKALDINPRFDQAY